MQKSKPEVTKVVSLIKKNSPGMSIPFNQFNTFTLEFLKWTLPALDTSIAAFAKSAGLPDKTGIFFFFFFFFFILSRKNF